MLTLAATRYDVEAPRPRVRWQLTPLDLVYIFLIDLPHPALVGGHILSRRSILLRSIYIHNGVVRKAPRMPKYGHTRRRRRLAPRILLRVIHLHIVHRSGLSSSPDYVYI